MSSLDQPLFMESLCFSLRSRRFPFGISRGFGPPKKLSSTQGITF